MIKTHVYHAFASKKRKNNAKTVEAGLVADRHDGMPVDKFIYDASFDESLMFDYPEQEDED